MDKPDSDEQQPSKKWSLWKTRYHFYGKHGIMVKKLEEYKYIDGRTSIFICAPLIGFLFNRRSPRDEDTGEQVSVEDVTLETKKDTIMTVYRLIMLMDKDYEPDAEKRIEKAFRNTSREMTDESQRDIERFGEYVYGGIEVLYEKLVDEDLSGGRINTKDLIDEVRGFGLLIDALAGLTQNSSGTKIENLI